MRFPSVFTKEFWSDPVVHDANEVRYLHEPCVIPFPGDHARANAAQAAMSLEQDRSNLRDDIKAALMRERRQLMERVEQIDAALAELG